MAGGINIITNFEVNTNKPLDDRELCPNMAAVEAIPESRRYPGLQIYVEDIDGEGNPGYVKFVDGVSDANIEKETSVVAVTPGAAGSIVINGLSCYLVELDMKKLPTRYFRLQSNLSPIGVRILNAVDRCEGTLELQRSTGQTSMRFEQPASLLVNNQLINGGQNSLAVNCITDLASFLEFRCTNVSGGLLTNIILLEPSDT